MARVTAPNPETNGIHAGVEFVSGVGETDNPGALAYFRAAGYSIDQPADAAERAASIDSRDVGVVKVGTPLRDAAVDPRPGDYLAPSNAGEADPHGPLVVNPEIHGEGPGPIVPGLVSDDPAVQDAIESAVSEAVKVRGVSVPLVTAAAAIPDPPTEPERPAKSASAADWRAYAESQGVDSSGSKAEIIARFNEDGS